MNEPAPTEAPESRCPDGRPRPPHAAVSARARHRIATRRDPAPWLAVLVTVALIGGAVLTIVLGAAPPIPPPPVVRTPVVAPLAPVPVVPAPAVTIIVGKNARPGSDCADEDMAGVDDNGTATECRPTRDGRLRWVRR